MRRPTTPIHDFFRAPSLPRQSRTTYRYHLAFAVLDAVAGGILANAPFVALKVLGATEWQLGLNLTLSGAGMLFTLYLGSWMASRPKMPFVFLPGVAGALVTSGMVLTENSLVFLTLGGLGLMFNTISRPAVTAVIRCNYPPTHRGLATGEIRKWSSLVFLAVFLLSAAQLDLVAHLPAADRMQVVRLQIVLGSLVSVGSFLCFRRIHVQEDLSGQRVDLRPEVVESFYEAARVLQADRRYLRYLAGGFLFGFSLALYSSYIPAFLVRDLKYSYVQCSLLMHVIPATAAFLATGLLGRWIDRSNPWWSWAWIRFGSGVDGLLLAATKSCAVVLPALGTVLPVVARTSLGSVQGASWILWWQVGVGPLRPTRRRH